MTAQGQKSFGSKSLIAMLLMSIVGVILLAATARAEDCLAAPNSPAREGTGWYYRLDRATQHKCWYVRALGQPAQQVAARAKMAPSAAPFAIPVPRPRPSAAGSALSLSPGDTDPSSSHAEGIVAKLSATPVVSGSTDETTPSIPSESASQQARTSLAAPAANATPLIGAATDETTSAISEMHQAATSPESTAGATARVPDAETLIGATTDEGSSPTSDIAAPQQAATLSEPDAEMTASGPNAAPRIIAMIDDTALSIPKDSATELSTHSEFRSNAAEPAPDVSVAEPQAPLAVATINAGPIPPDAPADLVSVGRERTALPVEPIDNAAMPLRPFLLILTFALALVGLLYYVVLKYLPGGSARISTDHPEDDCVDDDQYNNPEFYRKLRQGCQPKLRRSGGGASTTVEQKSLTRHLDVPPETSPRLSFRPPI